MKYKEQSCPKSAKTVIFSLKYNKSQEQWPVFLLLLYLNPQKNILNGFVFYFTWMYNLYEVSDGHFSPILIMTYQLTMTLLFLYIY